LHLLGYSVVPNPEAHASVDDFVTRWSAHFRTAPDLFELQRGLNNCFAYDLVPPVPVVREALRAARRLNDFATAVRVFGALRQRTESDTQYRMYLETLKTDIEELGICAPEDLGRND
jgi:cytochrome c oxidase subunit 5a